MSRRGGGDRERQWRERLGRFGRSGLTVSAFCRREGVSTAAFYSWKRRLETAPQEPLFVPVTVRTTPAAEVRIELPGGAVVRIPHGTAPELVRAVIRAAAEPATEREADAC